MRNQIYSRGNVSEKSTVKTYYIQAEYTRRWLGYHDTYDTYNYCVFSEELTFCGH